MMLALEGSSVDRRDGFWAIRTPDNPRYNWGNFLLLDAPMGSGEVTRWLDVYAQEFPGRERIAFGVDRPDGEAGPTDEMSASGLNFAAAWVLTASTLSPPPPPKSDAEIRMLSGDEDWQGVLDMRLESNENPDTEDYVNFVQRKFAGMRRLQEAGAGGWFGAFLDGDMVSGVGIFSDGADVARFQVLETRPNHRGQGLARTLAHVAGTYGLEKLGARTLAMVTEADNAASLSVYRSLGFTVVESQLMVSRRREA